jgi:arsenite-transporting ATPase
MAAMPERLKTLPMVQVRLKSRQVIGVDALRSFFDAEPASAALGTADVAQGPALPTLEHLVDELQSADHGLIMTMGKGGVGKTSVAVRIALELARRGHTVHLTTTDPAAHLLQSVTEVPPGLSIGRIDPQVEVERYRADVQASAGASLDANGLALLMEDLSSPCTEEIAVFQAFAREVDKGADRFVVVDTAPTGHTILLLDAAQSYHRELQRQSKGATAAVLSLLPRLRDPGFTRILLCTLAEATPVHEAAALQADLRRAQIEPFAWVINQSLGPLRLTDPVLQARQSQERRYLDEVRQQHATRIGVVPWSAQAV